MESSKVRNTQEYTIVLFIHDKMTSSFFIILEKKRKEKEKMLTSWN